MEISKKKSFFLISQGSLNSKISFLGQKVRSVARHNHKMGKNYHKMGKNGNFEKQKKWVYFLCPKDPTTQKLGSQVKRCSHNHKMGKNDHKMGKN